MSEFIATSHEWTAIDEAALVYRTAIEEERGEVDPLLTAELERSVGLLKIVEDSVHYQHGGNEHLLARYNRVLEGEKDQDGEPLTPGARQRLWDATAVYLDLTTDEHITKEATRPAENAMLVARFFCNEIESRKDKIEQRIEDRAQKIALSDVLSPEFSLEPTTAGQLINV